MLLDRGAGNRAPAIISFGAWNKFGDPFFNYEEPSLISLHRALLYSWWLWWLLLGSSPLAVMIHTTNGKNTYVPQTEELHLLAKECINPYLHHQYFHLPTEFPGLIFNCRNFTGARAHIAPWFLHHSAIGIVTLYTADVGVAWVWITLLIHILQKVMQSWLMFFTGSFHGHIYTVTPVTALSMVCIGVTIPWLKGAANR